MPCWIANINRVLAYKPLNNRYFKNKIKLFKLSNSKKKKKERKKENPYTNNILFFVFILQTSLFLQKVKDKENL